MPWTTVLPDAAWNFEYCFHARGDTANTCVMKLRDGELLAFSPGLGLTDADFAELEKHGKPVGLVAPNGFHHLGLPEWKKRYPDVRVFAPDSAAKRIGKKHPGLTLESMSALSRLCPENVMVLDPPGMRIPDVVARISSPAGAAWYFNDTVMNLRKVPKGFLGKVMQWTDSAPGFKVVRFFTLFAVKDKRAWRGAVLPELERATPTAVVPGHGAVVTDASVAATLPDLLRAAI